MIGFLFPCIASFAMCTALSARAAERTIAVAASGCALAAHHQPAGDVRYRPGVGQDGQPVVPADVEDGRVDPLGESIPIIISADLQERFGIPHDSVLLASEAVIGVVVLRRSDGRLTFNGAPMSDREIAALSALCRERAGAE